MNGSRQVDNCYHWISNNSKVCHSTKEDQTWLWHRMLGHINLKSIDRAVKNDVVIGVPNIDQEKGVKILRIRSDHGKEFKNEDLHNFCNSEGIHHEYSALITPQQNEVVERKNRTLQEMARIIIHAKSLPLHFWAEAINIACHIHIRITTRSGSNVTLYELWKGRKPNVKYFHIFERTCYILADREYHRKWDAKSEQGLFLGSSQNSRAYKVFNNRTETVMETINIVVNDSEYTNKKIDDEEDETPKVTLAPTSTPADVSKADIETTNSNLCSKYTSKEAVVEGTLPIPSSHVWKNHPSSSIIGDPSAGITTRKKDKIDYSKMIIDLCYTSAIEPTSVEAALKDEYWINAMQEELVQFKRNNVWTLVPKPNGVMQGVDFDEIFVPVTRLEAIRLLLGISCIHKFKLYQMDVKSTFLNGYLNEEVYVAQPKGGFPKALVDNFIDIMKSEFEMSMSDPRTSHLTAIKRIIKYVHGTTDFGILYSYDTTSILVGYCDADWAGSADDRKSTSGGCFFLGNNLISWFSKKQNCVSLSKAEA
ncbi:gag-pol polyprotein [Cucumis melo var. makuwa]|uniref:Gag-pol polyprotein n=1 Tax=Cucumis melo var. makuwa TaxID=1194695 RepID=A0A5D3E3N7_CUCMM|nr:gag-pol polyprotein [Cucumis melo var. makuwa]